MTPSRIFIWAPGDPLPLAVTGPGDSVDGKQVRRTSAMIGFSKYPSLSMTDSERTAAFDMFY
jgi:hypothetical protein